MKIEVFDEGGKLMCTIPSTMRRGLSRATWSMRLKPPQVPPAASAAFGATIGPRVLQGTYTVKTFDAWKTNQLASVNTALAKKNLE